jgi:hypothetical protein
MMPILPALHTLNAVTHTSPASYKAQSDAVLPRKFFIKG